MNTVEPIRDPRKIVAIKKMLKGEEDPRNYLLFTLGINVALRISDLLQLKVGDVLDEQGNIRESFYVREQKTGKEKRVKLNEPAKEALEYYFKRKHPTDPDTPLFESPQRPGYALHRNAVYRLINRWCRDAGLTSGRYGTHTLRKTWGYQARKYHGVPIELIQAKLGHSSPKITRRYIGITADEIGAVENKVKL